MNTRWKFIIIALAFGIPAFFLGPIFWPPSPAVQPTRDQLPYLAVLSAIEAMSFGFGVAFILLGWPLVEKLAKGSINAGRIMHLSLSWIMISWWPHGRLHIHNALNINGLIAIDWAFHATVIAAGGGLIYSFFALLKPAAEPLEAQGPCQVDRPDCLTPSRT